MPYIYKKIYYFYLHNSGGDDDEPSNKDWKPQKPVTLLKKKEPQMEQKSDEN
jgi:hypothetical protein